MLLPLHILTCTYAYSIICYYSTPCRLTAIKTKYHLLWVYPVYNSRCKIVFKDVELKHAYFHTLSLSDKFILVVRQCQI